MSYKHQHVVCVVGVNASVSPNDSTTYYFGGANNVWNTSAGYSKIPMGVRGRVFRVDINFMSTNLPTQETFDIDVRLNDTTDYRLATGTRLENSYFTQVSNKAMDIPIAPDDFLEIKTTTPAWVTNPTSTKAVVYVWIRLGA